MTVELPTIEVDFPFDAPVNCITTIRAHTCRFSTTRKNSFEFPTINYWFPTYNTPWNWFAARPHLLKPGLQFGYYPWGLAERYTWNGSEFTTINPYYGGNYDWVGATVQNYGRDIFIASEMSPTLGNTFPGGERDYNCLIGRKIWFREIGYGATITAVNYGTWNDGEYPYSWIEFGNVQYLGPQFAGYGSAYSNLGVSILDSNPHMEGNQWWGWLGGHNAPLMRNVATCGSLMGGDAHLAFDGHVEIAGGYSGLYFVICIARDNPSGYDGISGDTYNFVYILKSSDYDSGSGKWKFDIHASLCQGEITGTPDSARNVTLFAYVQEMGGFDIKVNLTNLRWLDCTGAPYSPNNILPGGDLLHTITIVREPAFF